MPWELTIRSKTVVLPSSSRDWPLLGQGEEVCRRISEGLPDVQWRREPSFIEQHQHLPRDHPIQKFIEEMTAEQREWSSRPKLKGLYEGEGFTLEFFCQDGPIQFFQVDARGSRNPMQPLVRVCKANGWAVQDVTGKVVDLDSPRSESWDAFVAWRDRAINETAEKRKTENAGE
jgi:hypothetical protein